MNISLLRVEFNENILKLRLGMNAGKSSTLSKQEIEDILKFGTDELFKVINKNIKISIISKAILQSILVFIYVCVGKILLYHSLIFFNISEC